jgi:hypothetical protein
MVCVECKYFIYRLAACLYSILLETGVGANDCKCSWNQQLNMPSEHGGASTLANVANFRDRILTTGLVPQKYSLILLKKSLIFNVFSF